MKLPMWAWIVTALVSLGTLAVYVWMVVDMAQGYCPNLRYLCGT